MILVLDHLLCDSNKSIMSFPKGDKPGQNLNTNNNSDSQKKPLTKFEHELSRYYFPLFTIVPPLHRATHSDVLCISNNGTRKDYDEHSSSSTSCQLPYEEIYASNASRRKTKRSQNNGELSNFNSSSTKEGTRKRSSRSKGKATLLLHEKNSLESRKRLDKQLHDEHRMYMSNLQKEREEQFQIETNAVLLIQKVIRGFRVRLQLFPERYDMWVHKKGVVYSEDQIWTRLLDAASKVGIRPKERHFLGYSLPKKFQPDDYYD